MSAVIIFPQTVTLCCADNQWNNYKLFTENRTDTDDIDELFIYMACTCGIYSIFTYVSSSFLATCSSFIKLYSSLNWSHRSFSPFSVTRVPHRALSCSDFLRFLADPDKDFLPRAIFVLVEATAHIPTRRHEALIDSCRSNNSVCKALPRGEPTRPEGSSGSALSALIVNKALGFGPKMKTFISIFLNKRTTDICQTSHIDFLCHTLGDGKKKIYLTPSL